MPEINTEEIDRSWGKLMLRVQKGEKEALTQLFFSEISPVLLGYFTRKVSYWGIPDEALQKTLITIYNKRSVYLPRRSFRAWMFTIAKHKLIDEIRKKAADFDALPIGNEAVTFTEPYTYSNIQGVEGAQSEESEDVSHLRGALEELSPEQREVIQLTKLEGYSVKEVAEKMGITESAVKVRVHRGFKKLCEIMTSNLNEQTD